MENKIKFGLKLKFVSVVTLLIIVIMVTTSFIIISREKEIIERKMEQSGMVLIRSLSNAAVGPLVQGLFEDIKSFMGELKTDKVNNSNMSSRDIAYAYLIDENSGTIVVHINNIGNENYELDNVSKFKNDPIMQSAIKCKKIIKRRTVVNGKKVIDLAMPIMTAGTKYGTLRIGLDLSRMETEIKKTTRNVIILGLVAIILGFFVSILMANIILKPVYALLKGAERVSVGEFKHHIQVNTKDELGVLAQTFNRMTYNISVLYNVSNAMNFISDSDKLLNIILDKALEALQAERGSLMIYDDDDNTLMVKVIRGLEGEAAGFIKIRVGDGVAGQVASTGEAMIVNKGDKDERFKKFQKWINRSSIESLLCVPLKIEDKLLGVINVVNKRNNSNFNENDLKLMMVLGSQAAVTLSKAKLYEDSITDGMTKLYIHRYFQARLDDELKRARRYKTKLTLLMFDIDHFKNFNDTYGHQQGDVVIINVARIIKDSIRDNIDIASRYGGEEFTIIMPETGIEGAYILAERLRKNVENFDFPGQEKPLHVTISIGIASFPDDAVEKAQLIKLSDEALYFAKEAGRNNTQIYRDHKKDV